MQEKKISNVTIVGMGIMGPDIALCLAIGGCKVTALGRRQEGLDAAKLRNAATLEELIALSGIFKEDADKILSRISFTTDWDKTMPDADFVIEAVSEKLEIKKGIFNRCGELCRPEVIIASNTSSISITDISSEMRNPERAITTHWLIPAFLIPVVEVIPGKRTSEQTIEITKKFLTQMGKRPAVCKESPAFVHNYIQASMLNAAIKLVELGVCSAEDVDAIVENGFALRLANIGPVRMVDYVGIDTIMAFADYVYEKTGDPAFKGPELLKKKLAKGELGMKSGKGMYSYPEGEAQRIRKLADETIIKVKKALNK